MSRVEHTILVVDDEPAQRQLVSAALGKNYQVTAAASGQEAQELLSSRSFDLVITDERMPGMSGLDLVRWIREHDPAPSIIVLTAYGSVETAVEAMKLGADEYLTKPLKSPEELRLVVQRTIRQRMLQNLGIVHAEESEGLFPPDIIAESEAMKQVLALALQVAVQPTTVLLTGESGTGKEVVARLIHRRSPRRENPFVAVNCAALHETLLESELFGHEKGAFTGATQSRPGRFELAHGGTIFLDEVAEMSIGLQAKLLRVLQEREFERVGGNRTIHVDVRVVAATNQDLQATLAEKSFREDLFYRLNVFPIHLEPLRRRHEDIKPLAYSFARKLSARMGRGFKSLSPEAERILLRHDWPGNVRELQNAMERALIVAGSEVVQAQDLPFQAELRSSSTARGKTLADLEKNAILEALAQNRGERRLTAEQLGVSLRKLQYRLKEYGLTGKK